MESNGFEKMRSGILEIRKVLHKIYIGEIPIEKHTISAVIGRCDSMLEIPLRNCDVGTVYDQYKRHRKMCHKKCIRCKYDKYANPCARCFAELSQLPYESEEPNELCRGTRAD